MLDADSIGVWQGKGREDRLQGSLRLDCRRPCLSRSQLDIAHAGRWRWMSKERLDGCRLCWAYDGGGSWIAACTARSHDKEEHQAGEKGVHFSVN